MCDVRRGDGHERGGEAITFPGFVFCGSGFSVRARRRNRRRLRGASFTASRDSQYVTFLRCTGPKGAH
eukprot:1867039-Prymnesium_polylepis.1